MDQNGGKHAITLLTNDAFVEDNASLDSTYRQYQGFFNCMFSLQATVVNISLVTVNCFLFDVIVFAMMK